MGFLEKAKNIFTYAEDEDYGLTPSTETAEVAEEEKVEIKYRGINSFKQVKEVCDCLRKDFPVVINLQSATPEVICRATDYLSGVLDAIDGDIIAIGINMWICTPKNVVVEGKYVEAIQQDVDKGNKRFMPRVPQELPPADIPVSPYAKR